MNKPKEIIILGEKIDEQNFPRIFELARTNRLQLEETIKGMMKKQGFDTPGSAMAILESDLG